MQLRLTCTCISWYNALCAWVEEDEYVASCTLGFFSSSWLTTVDGMKDLWCSSTVRLLSTQIQMG